MNGAFMLVQDLCTCIFSTKHNTRYSISAIMHHLKILSKWFSYLRTAINVFKTEAIPFINIKGEKRDRYKIKFLKHELLWSDNCKYLEVILDYNLTFKNHLILPYKTHFVLLKINNTP